MAKLVEVLARELKVWPDSVDHIVQSMVDFELYGIGNHDVVWRKYIINERCDDGTLITRPMWQSERDRQKGGEWRRHRGGKQPVDGTEYVEVRLRDGDIQKSYARCFAWPYSACDHYANIMAYRVLEKPEREENVVELKGEAVTLEYQICGEGEEPNHDAWQEIGGNPQSIGTITYTVDLNTEPAIQKIEELQAKWDQLDGPLKWRDHIIELEAHAEDIEREIAKLFGKLNAEGLQLIRQYPMANEAEVAQVDMQDWRNWKLGDMVTVLNAEGDGTLTAGEQYPIVRLEGNDYYGDVPAQLKDNERVWLDLENMKWHSRPVK